MPIAVTRGTRVGPTVGASLTTGSFNPPASSLVVGSGVIDSSGTTNPTATFSNNGAAGLTWAELIRRGGNESGADPGTVVIGGVLVPAARTGMTVTLASSISGRSLVLKPYIITGHDPAGYIGAVNEGSTGLNNNVLTVPTALTTTRDGSLVLIIANESESGPGTPTSPTPDLTIDPYVSSGNHSGAMGDILIPAAGTSVGFTIDAAGTGTNVRWNWVAVEILAAADPADTTRFNLANQ